MQRIDSKYTVPKLPKAKEAEAAPGYFSGGNAEGETPGTVISPSWLNMVQEEIMAVVNATGQAPDKAKLNQLLTGIKYMIDEDPKSNGAVNAAQAAAKIADEANKVSQQAASSASAAVKVADEANQTSRQASSSASSAVKTANDAEGIAKAAEDKADKALAHTEQNSGTPLQILHAQDEKDAGVAGGTFVGGGWRFRDLGIVKTNTIPGALVALDHVTLPPGSYWIEASAPAFAVNAHLLEFGGTNIGKTFLVGTTAAAPPPSTQTRSFVSGLIKLTEKYNISLKHYCVQTKETDGLGVAGLSGRRSVFAQLVAWRLPD